MAHYPGAYLRGGATLPRRLPSRLRLTYRMIAPQFLRACACIIIYSYASVAQWIRAVGFYPMCRGFESCRGRHCPDFGQLFVWGGTPADHHAHF